MQVCVGYRYFLFSPVLLVFLLSLRETLAVLCSTTASWWASHPTEEESVVSWKSLEFTPSSRTTPSGLTASWAHRPPRHRNQACKIKESHTPASTYWLTLLFLYNKVFTVYVYVLISHNNTFDIILSAHFMKKSIKRQSISFRFHVCLEFFFRILNDEHQKREQR